MIYITTAERIGMEKAYLKGLALGLAQSLAAIFEIKFGKAGQPLAERVYQIENAEALQKLMMNLKRVKSLSTARKLVDEIESPVAN